MTKCGCLERGELITEELEWEERILLHDLLLVLVY